MPKKLQGIEGATARVLETISVAKLEEGLTIQEALAVIRAVNSFEALTEALEAIQEGFRDGSIQWTKKRQSDNDPYHKANTLMCNALALARGQK